MQELDYEKLEEEAKCHVGEREKVAELGLLIGYGNMMYIASSLWQQELQKHGCSSGGAFIVGPCISSIVPCEHWGNPPKTKLTCDICCATGWVTKAVAEKFKENEK